MAGGAKVTTEVYKEASDIRLTLDVHKPKSDSEGAAPVALIHFHGGFLVIGEKTTFPPNWLINACHRRGWSYITPAYRLMPEVDGSEILSDAIDAVEWVSRNISQHIVIAGSSAGAYLALATAAARRSTINVLGCLFIYGMLDPSGIRYTHPGKNLMDMPNKDTEASLEAISAARTSGKALDGYKFPSDPSKDERWDWIATLHQEALYPDFLTGMDGLSEKIRKEGINSIPKEQRHLFPAEFGLNKEFPKTVLLHGESDNAVSIEQSQTMVSKLKATGVEAHLITVPDQGHGFDIRGIPEDIDCEALDEEPLSFTNDLKQVVIILDDIVRSSL